MAPERSRISIRTRVASSALPLAAALTLLMAGCAAVGPPGADSDAVTPAASASPTAPPSPTPEPTLPPIPETTPDEIARAEFVADGPEGIPSTSTLVSELTGPDIRLDGECVGVAADYRVGTAAAGEDNRVLMEGTMQCDTGVAIAYSGLTYQGPVQVSFTDANRIDSGWLRLVATTP
ncbi:MULTISPECIES: hypothetical protein [unclassified Microbacterium]|uniref:hypothetical protein n=1 Tax=unclassified Microbacterium TaxID=2609290 RepID=UPI0037477D6A